MSPRQRRLIGGIAALFTALGAVAVSAPANATPLPGDDTVSAPTPCAGPSRIDFAKYERVQPAGNVLYYGEAHNCTTNTVRIRLVWSVPFWANPNGPCTTVAPGGWVKGSSAQYPARSWNWC